MALVLDDPDGDVDQVVQQVSEYQCSMYSFSGWCLEDT